MIKDLRRYCDSCGYPIYCDEDYWSLKDMDICDSCIEDVLKETFDSLEFHERAELLDAKRIYGYL